VNNVGVNSKTCRFVTFCFYFITIFSSTKCIRFFSYEYMYLRERIAWEVQVYSIEF